MSRFLFVTVDAGGNVPPLLALARELVQAGHDVEVAGLIPRDPADVPAGVGLIPLKSTAFFESTTPRSLLKGISLLLRLATSESIAHEATQTVADRRPDAVVVDPLMPSTVRAAARTGVPTALVLHTFLTFWTGHFAAGPFAKLSRVFGAEPVRSWQHAQRVLVATDRDLDVSALPPSGTAHAVAALPQAEWVGSFEPVPTRSDRTDDGVPVVLVSLSSTFMPGQDAVYQRIMSALGTLPVRAIVTTGGADVGRLPAPPNVTVRGRADHAELMREATLLIGHGGHSTTMRALAHDLPAVILPLNPLMDQPLVGQAVEGAGAGRMLPTRADPAAIAAAVSDILADPGYASAAATIGARLRLQHGAKTAAGRLDDLVHGSPPRLGYQSA